MTRLNVVVEGQTEEAFVKQVLAPHLRGFDVYARPIVVSPSRARQNQDHFGGGGSFGKALREIRDLLTNDASAHCTTLFDYYGLPTDYPGLESDVCPPPSQLYDRIECLERCLAEEIDVPRRFIPYLQIHEFEALLFADVEVIDRAPRMSASEESRLDDLKLIVDHFDNPERIDEGEETAPSKRLAGLFPRYNKRVHGPMIAHDIGLPRLRDACPHFDEWMSRLESLDPLGPY
jgi:hypothetical protein